MIAGITGGLGCGKSTVARLLEKRGFRRLDSDFIVREQVLPRPEVIAALRTRFGADGVDSGETEGTVAVNRAALAYRIFADDTYLVWLEELTRPAVFAAWRAAFAAEPKARWAVEVPLLHEKGLENWFDFT